MSLIDNFDLQETGDGSVVEYGNGTGLRCSATGSGSALVRRVIHAVPGATYKATFTARVVSTSGTQPYFVVDYPSTGVGSDQIDLSTDFETHAVEFTVPYNSSPGDVVAFVFGVFVSTGGVVEFSNIRFYADDQPIPYLKTVVDAPLRHASAGAAQAGAFADVDISRTGHVVTISGELKNTSSQASPNLYTAFDVLPQWAFPRDGTVGNITQLVTAQNTIYSITAATNGQIGIFKREVGSAGITNSDFGTDSIPFTLSYVSRG
tara:strand:+ start:2316 stop:3104 length:789 start_codon:yes stop_codon:yes gene_type:complete